MLSTGRPSIRIAALAVLLGFVALLVPATACAGTSGARFAQAEKSWDFERIDVAITVNPDSSFHVKESVVVNFHGSFHFLNHPISTRRGGFTGGRTYGGVRVKNVKVYDAQGRQLDKGVEVKSTSDGPVVRISFAAADEQKGWIYEYDYRGAIIFGPDADRLYYNAVGSDRDVPVKQSRVTVAFPKGTDMGQVEHTFYDIPGAAPGSVQSGVEGNTVWYTTEEVPPGSAFTIDVQFPRGVVAPPWLYSDWFLTLAIVLGCVLLLGTLAVMLWMWWSRGRDAGRPDLDVVRYEPPSDLKPAMVGVLVNETAVDADISATIVDLAVRGKLVINELEKAGIFKRTEFGFDRTGADESDLEGYESEVMSGLFESGNSVRESDLEDKFYTHLGTIYLRMKDEVLSRGLFDGDPAKVKGRYALIAALALIAGLFIAVFVVRWLDLGYMNVLGYSLVPCAVVVFIVGRYMPRRTAKGSEALSYVMGFKDYMSTAEKGELEWMTPENFQSNLPYAIVLGVTDKWAAKFEDIYVSPPDWYRGTYAGGFSAVYLADSLSGMQTSMSSTMTSSPSSSGSGGGGGFGGGSSGGGFGGGGFSAG